MKYLLTALICVAIAGELIQASRLSSQDWMLYKSKHGKSYESPAEDARRFANFMATKQKVYQHNAQRDITFTMGLNHMADWTQEERAHLGGLKLDQSTQPKARQSDDEAYLAEILASSSEPVPDEFDWRTVPGRVTAVKDQGKRCRSDWAFAAVGALEGQEIVRVVNKSSQVVQLSEQELVDCSESNKGCHGGTLEGAFDDLKKLGGIMSSKDYPYTGKGGKCAFDKNKIVMANTGYVTLPANETLLKEVLFKFGPIPITVQHAQALLAHESKSFKDPQFSFEVPKHKLYLLLVGYATDPINGDYWIAKTSYGPDYGEHGYTRVDRHSDRMLITPIIPKF